jgi:RHS repeat-associated protein
MSARYTVIDGEVVAQERGGVRHQLVPDPLGSTVALYDDSGTKTDTFSYWPYGESSSRTGTTKVKFQYIGYYGCYHDNSSTYVRNRYFLKKYTSWISEDKIGNLIESKYNYCHSSPISYIDIDGFLPIIIHPWMLGSGQKLPPYKEPTIPHSAFQKCCGKSPCARKQADIAEATVRDKQFALLDLTG